VALGGSTAEGQRFDPSQTEILPPIPSFRNTELSSKALSYLPSEQGSLTWFIWKF